MGHSCSSPAFPSKDPGGRWALQLRDDWAVRLGGLNCMSTVAHFFVVGPSKYDSASLLRTEY